VAKGAIWWLFLRPVGDASLWLTIKATLAGAAVNNFLVAHSGDAARVVLVSRAMRRPSSLALAALALERIFDAAGYVVLLVAAAFLLPMPALIARWRLPAAALVAVMAALILLRLRRPPAGSVPEAVEDERPATLLGRAAAYFRSFGRSMAQVTSAGRLAAALALSMVSWFAQVATYHLTAVAAHFPISLAGTIAALLAVNLSFLLRATPGNVGIFQATYALAAGAMGLARDPAIAVAVLIQLVVQLIPTTILGAALVPGIVLRRRPEDAAEQALDE
jgi:phosphatidylinositol alpha-mannosyltransferase